MMDRRRFLLTSVIGAVSAPIGAAGQPLDKVRRIGHLGGASSAAIAPWLETLRRALAELGWRVGQNIIIENRSVEGRFERLPAAAAELVRLPVDLIIAGTTPAAEAARQATTTIPIVTTVVSDPVGSGLIASLARPGGNVTGLTLLVGPEIVGKYLELLKAAVPALSRLALLWNPAQTAHVPLIRQAETAARSIGCQLRLVPARSPAEFDGAFIAMGQERADALLVLADPMFFQQRTRLANLAEKNRLPAMYGLREHVEAGGLMTYAASIHDLYRRAALYIDKIFKGAKPSDLPVEQPSKFELVINLKTAKALGLTIPPSLLARADQVIE
jgi:putative tryptophan/tyrosine transport system substrate-binding protein